MPTINTDKLLEGMVLTESIYSEKTGDLLLKEGVTLSKQKIKAIKNNNIEKVKVADRYTLLINATTATYNELEKILNHKIKRLAPETPEANTATKMVDISKKVRKLMLKIINNEAVLEFCTRMKLIDNDLFFMHSATTCALSLLVAGAMGLDDKEIIKIGTAALLHDIGLGEMPFLIKRKGPEAPRSDLWEQHPTYGFHIAKEEGIDRDICKMILHHHENWNGSGFPDNKKGAAIPLGSRIISVCEIYDTLIRYSDYPRYEAIEYLYGGGDFLFDTAVVQAFTDNLAVYPLGSLVRLSNNKVGVVVNVRKNKGPRPIVRIEYNNVNRKINSKTVDLGKEKTMFITEII
ncbi:MAG: HD-GYP domain-containing protein [Bacillota bacterium]